MCVCVCVCVCVGGGGGGGGFNPLLKSGLFKSMIPCCIFLFCFAGSRIRESDLLTVLSNTERENVQAYICGPPPMIDTMVDVLTNNRQCKLSSEQIHFERWW